MGEHDPLPWHCSRIIRETGRAAGCDIGAANGANVALVLHDPDDSTRRQTLANASYIVTAANAYPELVSACEAALDRSNYQGTGEPWSHLFEQVRTALRNAGVTDA